jgi:hypothetical protein
MRTRGRSFQIAVAKHAIFAQKYGRLLQLPGGARFVIFLEMELPLQISCRVVGAACELPLQIIDL